MTKACRKLLESHSQSAGEGKEKSEIQVAAGMSAGATEKLRGSRHSRIT